MDASYKIQRGIHVHLIQFFMCPEFWVHITEALAPYFFARKAELICDESTAATSCPYCGNPTVVPNVSLTY